LYIGSPPRQTQTRGVEQVELRIAARKNDPRIGMEAKRMNLASQPLVSVVTPVYNEEECLPECIESILCQTYQNWEYTILNNGSTDRSLEIARRYAAKDPRIRVHDNDKFLRMLANHNLALRKISPASKYCKVVLADDFIFPDCLEKMVKVAEAYPSAGIVSSYQLHGQQVRSAGLPYTQQLVRGCEACRQFLLQTITLFGSQNSVLYRADLVRGRDPFYVETDMCADFEACFALLKVSDLGFVHQVLTFSRPRPESIGTVSSDSGATRASLLGILLAYGKDCLSEAEFKHCLKLQLSQYYEFLGRRLWVERDLSFLAFHRRALKDAGFGFSRACLATAAVSALWGVVFNPKSVFERIQRLVSLHRIRGRQVRQVVSGFESVSIKQVAERNK
jgi:glycosyltransferase involved in cell wall biosynthesis